MSTYKAKLVKGEMGKHGHAEIITKGKLGGTSPFAAASVEWTVSAVYGSPNERGIDLARRMVKLLNAE